jgi:DNA repair exonuclease SbcCD ATPase subunit
LLDELAAANNTHRDAFAKAAADRDHALGQARAAASRLAEMEGEKIRAVERAAEHRQQLDVATQQRDALVRERDEIAARLAQTDSNFNQRVNALNSEHKKQIDSLMANQKAQIESLHRQREREMHATGVAQTAELRAQIEALKQERDKAASSLTRVRTDYKEQIEALGEQLRRVFAERDEALSRLAHASEDHARQLATAVATGAPGDPLREELQRALRDADAAKRAQNQQMESFARDLSTLVKERDEARAELAKLRGTTPRENPAPKQETEPQQQASVTRPFAPPPLQFPRGENK